MKKIFSFLLFAFLIFLFTDKVAAQVLPDGTYNIQSALSEDKMVDLFAGDTTNNTNIQLFTANGKNSQKWVIRHIDNDYYNASIEIVSLFKTLYATFNSAVGVSVSTT